MRVVFERIHSTQFKSLIIQVVAQQQNSKWGLKPTVKSSEATTTLVGQRQIVAQSANPQSSPWTHPRSRIGTTMNQMKMTIDHLICKIAICGFCRARANSRRAACRPKWSFPVCAALRSSKTRRARSGNSRSAQAAWIRGPSIMEPVRPFGEPPLISRKRRQRSALDPFEYLTSVHPELRIGRSFMCRPRRRGWQQPPSRARSPFRPRSTSLELAVTVLDAPLTVLKRDEHTPAQGRGKR
jgi:hypothetical protein